MLNAASGNEVQKPGETGKIDYIHRFLPAKGLDAPTLLLLHGTGGDESDLLELGGHLMPDAALLSPRGRVLEGAMPRFFRRLSQGVFDLDDLRFRTSELAAFLDSAALEYGFDRSRVVAIGYSNGANIAASLILQIPGVLEGAVLFHAQVPFVPLEPPILHGLPVFMAAGRADTMIPADESRKLAALLESAGADITMLWQPGGHALVAEEVDAARRWMARFSAMGLAEKASFQG